MGAVVISGRLPSSEASQPAKPETNRNHSTESSPDARPSSPAQSNSQPNKTNHGWHRPRCFARHDSPGFALCSFLALSLLCPIRSPAGTTKEPHSDRRGLPKSTGESKRQGTRPHKPRRNSRQWCTQQSLRRAHKNRRKGMAAWWEPKPSQRPSTAQRKAIRRQHPVVERTGLQKQTGGGGAGGSEA